MLVDAAAPRRSPLADTSRPKTDGGGSGPTPAAAGSRGKRGWKDAAFAGAALFAATLYAALSVWLWRQPASLSSDDALHFARALTRFSILDFSPHFPGYPVFVGLGRLTHMLVPDPVAALQATTTAIALALPFVVALAAWAWTRERWAALAAFCLTFSLPLLPVLALSGLSDGAGLLFFVLFLALLPPKMPDRPQPHGFAAVIAAGLALGLSAWARPSYGPILLAAWLAVAALSWRRAWLVLAGALLVTLAALAVLLAAEGAGYFHEGVRFLTGHTLVWGNTVLSAREEGASWVAVALRYPGIVVLGGLYGLAAVLGWRGQGTTIPHRAAIVAFGGAVAWTVLMQNPENLRHLAPALLLGGLLAATMPGSDFLRGGVVAAALALNGTLILSSWALGHTVPAPLAQAAGWLNRSAGPTLVVTSRGVGYLRAYTDTVRIYDLTFPQTARAGLASSGSPAYRLTDTVLSGCSRAAVFTGRALGEPDLVLYRLDRPRLTPRCADWETAQPERPDDGAAARPTRRKRF